MEILKNNCTVKITCPNCKSVLAVGFDDISYITSFGHGSRCFIDCPACISCPTVTEQVPRHWRTELGKLYEPDWE